tara:strand:+ start:4828 stop:4947 length:120 start_codon:yes stop_codon:yes gene_type:complete
MKIKTIFKNQYDFNIYSNSTSFFMAQKKVIFKLKVYENN